MKPFLSAVLLLGVLLSSRAEQAPSPVVLGYYPSWTDELPVEKINYRLFTHLVHAFATIHHGSIKVEGNLPSSDLTRLAHAAGVKVLLGLGGADSGPDFSAMARDKASEDACIKSLVKMVGDHGYDGIDVDWEFPAATEVDRVVDFVTKLRLALRQANPQALVTMPLPAADYYGQYFDGARLAPLLDFVMIMTYDVHGPWKEGDGFSHSGFNSPLGETDSDPVDGHANSFQKSADYWRGRGFADQQLLVGLPFFGHGFMVKKWGDTPLKASSHTDLEYRKIFSLLSAGWQRKWDDQASVPWLQSPPGLPAELISYDDPQSVELKAKWAREAGLRGVFFWEISQDFIEGRNVLVEAARKRLGLPPSP
ncbi:hypothetical protein BH09VER1_BH09VER1_03040 [soil metagenome]